MRRSYHVTDCSNFTSAQYLGLCADDRHSVLSPPGAQVRIFCIGWSRCHQFASFCMSNQSYISILTARGTRSCLVSTFPVVLHDIALVFLGIGDECRLNSCTEQQSTPPCVCLVARCCRKGVSTGSMESRFSFLRRNREAAVLVAFPIFQSQVNHVVVSIR